MLHLHRQLELIAKEELTSLGISGLVVGVRFIYDNACPMIRIAFCPDVKPKPILTGFDYIEKDEYDNTIYNLYMAIDVNIQVK